jgi:hypothetical protein
LETNPPESRSLVGQVSIATNAGNFFEKPSPSHYPCADETSRLLPIDVLGRSKTTLDKNSGLCGESVFVIGIAYVELEKIR